MKTGFRKRGISDARRRKIGRKGTREEEERYEGTRRERGGREEGGRREVGGNEEGKRRG